MLFPRDEEHQTDWHSSIATTCFQFCGFIVVFLLAVFLVSGGIPGSWPLILMASIALVSGLLACVTGSISKKKKIKGDDDRR